MAAYLQTYLRILARGARLIANVVQIDSTPSTLFSPVEAIPSRPLSLKIIYSLDFIAPAGRLTL